MMYPPQVAVARAAPEIHGNREVSVPQVDVSTRERIRIRVSESRELSTYAAPRHVVQQRPLPATIPQVMEHPSALIIRHSKRHDARDAQELQSDTRFFPNFTTPQVENHVADIEDLEILFR